MHGHLWLKIFCYSSMFMMIEHSGIVMLFHGNRRSSVIHGCSWQRDMLCYSWFFMTAPLCSFTFMMIEHSRIVMVFHGNRRSSVVHGCSWQQDMLCHSWFSWQHRPRLRPEWGHGPRQPASCTRGIRIRPAPVPPLCTVSATSSRQCHVITSGLCNIGLND